MSSAPTFRARCGTRFLESIIRDAFASSGALKVLVVDAVALRVVSSVLRMYDLLEEGVTLVESLEMARQPLPAMEAIYVLTPTVDSVQAMIADYAKPKKRLYGDAHVYFIGPAPDDLMSMLGSARMARRLKTLKELPFEFLVPEASVFSLDDSAGLVNAFGSDAVRATSSRRLAASLGRKLVGVAAALGSRPVVRYAAGSQLARATAAAFVEACRGPAAEPLFAAAGSSSSSSDNPVEFLIVDRSIDPLAPLLHELTYQAMCVDLLPLGPGNKYVWAYTDGAGKDHEKTVLLDESDPLWASLRHMHIRDAIEWVQAEFAEFVRSNRTAQMRGQRMDSLAAMSQAIRGLPQYQELLAKYSLHIQVCQDLLGVFNASGLEPIIDVEQNMATGETADGAPAANIMSTLLPILQDPSVALADKKRLVMTYIISQAGLRPAERAKLMEKARFSPADQAAVANLANLQVQVQVMPGSSGSKAKKKKKKKNRAVEDEDVAYELSRWAPVLKTIARDFVEGHLDADAWPVVPGSDADARPRAADGSGAAGASSAGPRGKSLRSRRSKWASKRKGKGKTDGASNSKTTFVVFVIGGVAHSEMRSMYEVQASTSRTLAGNIDLLIGGTHILTPTDYVQQIAALDPYDAVPGGADGFDAYPAAEAAGPSVV